MPRPASSMVCDSQLIADEGDDEKGGMRPAGLWQRTGSDEARHREAHIREFRAGDEATVRRIFSEGIQERIPNTALRGLWEQRGIQVVYAIITIFCLGLTHSLLLTCCVPLLLLALRYYYSRQLILRYASNALCKDMADIPLNYIKTPGSCFWVAVLGGDVVGIVGARAHTEDNTVELCRMSVDSRYRGRGIAKALGRTVIDFALANGNTAVVLSTTAVKIDAHRLYQSLGFKHMGVTEDYVLPGMDFSLPQRLFFQLRYHRYRLQIREE
ncbi:N-acetylaspartate synthetase [Petromyzon marinus]|uniref:N-acetylaspartate synthetase n=1 Tax=Petromyzon marinus TaxID=7757 RepID=A0AAJ7SWQ4_PETMA|nr:N-acetylaspartate synthetase [Petromyzon marinus]